MVATSIRFIEAPPFDVDFSLFSRKPTSEEKVQPLAFATFKLVQTFFLAVRESGASTLRYSWVSFKHIVLGYYGPLSSFTPPKDLYLAVFKVIIWAGSVSWCFLSTTARLFYQGNSSSEAVLLEKFAGDQIDPSHITTKELSIDVSNIPPDITVSSLSLIFDKINFTNPALPGYMAPLSRKEGPTQYSVEDLKKSLETFIRNVNGRVPFLGTPPSYDTPRLFAFYQQIEDAVRFCIHKVKSDLQPFEDESENAPLEGDALKKYKDLLEDQARFVISLAIAGNHCGARFMGEAMEAYDYLKGEESMLGVSFKDHLIELLASKRKKVAREHVQKYLGSDTHVYNKYMANLGPLLGIPGTKDVSEHLDRTFNKNFYLGVFFQEYNVDCILKTIQEGFQTSQSLREKFVDWVQAQIGDWSPDVAVNIQSLVSRARFILDKMDHLEANFPERLDFLNLKNLFKFLENRKISLPEIEGDGTEFLNDILALKEAKTWCKENLENDPRLPEDQAKIQKLKQAMKSLFSKDPFREKILRNHSSLKLHDFQEDLLNLQKISKLSELTKIEDEILERVVRGEKDLQEAILESEDRKRRPRFLEALNLGQIEEGLSKELLEWVSVSQGILKPQV